nr:unnamed protein product [Digitaria exilis]
MALSLEGHWRKCWRRCQQQHVQHNTHAIRTEGATIGRNIRGGLVAPPQERRLRTGTRAPCSPLVVSPSQLVSMEKDAANAVWRLTVPRGHLAGSTVSPQTLVSAESVREALRTSKLSCDACLRAPAVHDTRRTSPSRK